MLVAKQITLLRRCAVNAPDEITCPSSREPKAVQEACEQLVALFSYSVERFSEGRYDLMEDRPGNATGRMPPDGLLLTLSMLWMAIRTQRGLFTGGMNR